MKKNWTREKIIFELHSRKITLSSLSVEAGLAPVGLCSNKLKIVWTFEKLIIYRTLKSLEDCVVICDSFQRIVFFYKKTFALKNKYRNIRL